MVDRIQLILKVQNLTASRFADEIGVQRSSISHILSGRNMPSLDLITKILKRFPEIDSEWLLNGKGSMMKNQLPDLFNMADNQQETPVLVPENPLNLDMEIEQKPILSFDRQIVEEKTEQPEATENRIYQPELDIRPEIQKEIPLKSEKPATSNNGTSIEKIVIFYSNKTFREYYPEKE